MTRQQRRHEERAQAKLAASQQKADDRIAARRDRLRRQKERAASGFYDEAATVASRIAPSRSRVSERRVQKGKAFGRIILTNGDFALHATKGWRAA